MSTAMTDGLLELAKKTTHKKKQLSNMNNYAIISL